MSLPGSSTGRRKAASPAVVDANQGGKNGAEAGDPGNGKQKARLRLNPDEKHEPETYENLELDFLPSVFSSMERHLPQHLLHAPRDDKIKYMRDILHDYDPPALRNRVCFNHSLPPYYLLLVLYFNFSGLVLRQIVCSENGRK